MTCKHEMKKLRTSGYLKRGEVIIIEVWQCSNCNKYMIIDEKNGNRISLHNELGLEIENLN